MVKTTENTFHIDVKHLAAYAEDPRSYCHYRGVPRSIHNKQRKKIIRGNPISSNMSRYTSSLFILCFVLSCIGVFLYSQKYPDIAGIILVPTTVLYSTGALFLAATTFWIIHSFFIKKSIYKLFGVPASGYRMQGTTLILFGHPIKLLNGRLHGTPDAVFLSKDGKITYGCQYNPRDFKGRPKVRERYQMLQLMGMLMEKYKPESIIGAIRYHDHLETIQFEPELYRKLLELQNEYEEAVQKWVAPDDRPLFNRDNPL